MRTFILTLISLLMLQATASVDYNTSDDENFTYNKAVYTAIYDAIRTSFSAITDRLLQVNERNKEWDFDPCFRSTPVKINQTSYTLREKGIYQLSFQDYSAGIFAFSKNELGSALAQSTFNPGHQQNLMVCLEHHQNRFLEVFSNLFDQAFALEKNYRERRIDPSSAVTPSLAKATLGLYQQTRELMGLYQFLFKPHDMSVFAFVFQDSNVFLRQCPQKVLPQYIKMLESYSNRVSAHEYESAILCHPLTAITYGCGYAPLDQATYTISDISRPPAQISLEALFAKFPARPLPHQSVATVRTAYPAYLAEMPVSAATATTQELPIRTPEDDSEDPDEVLAIQLLMAELARAHLASSDATPPQSSATVMSTARPPTARISLTEEDRSTLTLIAKKIEAINGLARTERRTYDGYCITQESIMAYGSDELDVRDDEAAITPQLRTELTNILEKICRHLEISPTYTEAENDQIFPWIHENIASNPELYTANGASYQSDLARKVSLLLDRKDMDHYKNYLLAIQQIYRIDRLGVFSEAANWPLVIFNLLQQIDAQFSIDSITQEITAKCRNGCMARAFLTRQYLVSFLKDQGFLAA